MGGQRHRCLRAAVVAVSQTDHIDIAGVLAGGEDRDSLASLPRVSKVTHRQALTLWHMLGQLSAKLTDRRMKINGRRMLKLADLLTNFRTISGWQWPTRHGDDAGEAVEVLLAVSSHTYCMWPSTSINGRGNT